MFTLSTILALLVFFICRPVAVARVKVRSRNK